MSSAKILIVEDDRVLARALHNQLSQAGYQVISAASGSDAIPVARTGQPDLMILDLSLTLENPFDSLTDGFALLGWLYQTGSISYNIPVIIHTASRSPDLETRAQASGAFAVVRKGDHPQRLLTAVRDALEARGVLLEDGPAGTRWKRK
jgi:CheY-like chemotaxis protein